MSLTRLMISRLRCTRMMVLMLGRLRSVLVDQGTECWRQVYRVLRLRQKVRQTFRSHGTNSDGLSRHGDGSYYFANGDIFTGGWREGRQHGPGYQTFPNGNLLDGSWRDGQRDGVFIFVFPNGARYQTVYQGGVRQGGWTQIDPVPHNPEHFLSRN